MILLLYISEWLLLLFFFHLGSMSCHHDDYWQWLYNYWLYFTAESSGDVIAWSSYSLSDFWPLLLMLIHKS